MCRWSWRRLLVLFDFDMLFCIFRDLFDSVTHFFMIFVTFFFHPSWTNAVALQILFYPILADVRKFPKRAARVAASALFFLGIPLKSLDYHRNFLKFLFYLCPTRVNFCAANSNTFPGQVEGAANLLGRSPPPFALLRCFLFGRAISVFSARFFNRLRPKQNIGISRFFSVRISDEICFSKIILLVNVYEFSKFVGRRRGGGLNVKDPVIFPVLRVPSPK